MFPFILFVAYLWNKNSYYNIIIHIGIVFNQRCVALLSLCCDNDSLVGATWSVLKHGNIDIIDGSSADTASVADTLYAILIMPLWNGSYRCFYTAKNNNIGILILFHTLLNYFEET